MVSLGLSSECCFEPSNIQSSMHRISTLVSLLCCSTCHIVKFAQVQGEYRSKALDGHQDGHLAMEGRGVSGSCALVDAGRERVVGMVGCV